MAYHCVRGTVGAGQFRLLFGRDDADHRGTDVLRPLAKDQADAAAILKSIASGSFTSRSAAITRSVA